MCVRATQSSKAPGSPRSARAAPRNTTSRTSISASAVRRTRTATSTRCSSCPRGHSHLLRLSLHLPPRRRRLRPRSRPQRRRHRRRWLHRRLRRRLGLRFVTLQYPWLGRRGPTQLLLSWEGRTWRVEIAASVRARRRAYAAAGRKPTCRPAGEDDSNHDRCRMTFHRRRATHVPVGGMRPGFPCRFRAWIARIV